MDFNHHVDSLRGTRSPRVGSNARWSIPLLVTFCLFAAACGGGDAADAGVATLEDNEVATLSDSADAAVIPDDDAPETDPEEAALLFSQCMRDEGIDFPDLSVDAEGNIDLREGFQDVDRGDESFREAMDVCQGELSAGGFGGGRGEALASPELQDGLVLFSDCVRDEGFDVGDLTLGQGPGTGGNAGEAAGQSADQTADGAEGGDGPAQGQREGGFGNRSARIAEQLGLDPEGPAVTEVLELCNPILEEAFTAAGVAPRGAGQ